MFKIITYPMQTGIEFAPDVRVFNKELWHFIDELKETMVAYKLDGLSAAQVGNYYNLIVVQNGNEILEFINPRIIKKENPTKEKESTSYFPNITVDFTRYNKITLVYEDRFGNAKTFQANAPLSRIIQRKIDYIFGANYLITLKNEEKKLFEEKLIQNNLLEGKKYKRPIFYILPFLLITSLIYYIFF